MSCLWRESSAQGWLGDVGGWGREGRSRQKTELLRARLGSKHTNVAKEMLSSLEIISK